MTDESAVGTGRKYRPFKVGFVTGGATVGTFVFFFHSILLIVGVGMMIALALYGGIKLKQSA